MEMKNRSHTDKLTDLVGRRMDESRDGNALARAAYYSRFHFQRMFRQMTGETPMYYLTYVLFDLHSMRQRRSL